MKLMQFTKAQQEHVVNMRRSFNTSQAALANALNGSTVLGNASPLPRDVWGEWDREGIMVQRQVLAVFSDIAATASVPMQIGKLVHHFQRISDSGTAGISLDGRSRERTDQPVIDYVGTPLPIIDSTFSYGWRQIEAARTEGFQLDAGARENAMFKVAEKLENIALDGDSQIVVGGSVLYGLRTHPKRETRNTTNTLNGGTGAEWSADVNATLKLLHANNYRVPATLYVNWDDWFYANATDYSTQYPNKTIAQRILENGGVASVVPSSKVLADQIIAVVKGNQTVRMLNGMPMATVPQFRANPQDDYNFVTMAAAALEIKYDADDNCAVAVSTSS